MLFWSLFLPCAVTCVVETFVLLFFKDGKRRMLPQLFCNVVTNPLLHLLLPLGYLAIASLCGRQNAAWNAVLLTVSEIGIVFAEAGLCGLFIQEPFQKRLLFSALLNVASFSVGLIFSKPLDALFLWLIR